jgi:hypothetical protein
VELELHWYDSGLKYCHSGVWTSVDGVVKFNKGVFFFQLYIHLIYDS